MSADAVYLVIGLALAVAVVVPNMLWRLPFLSTPIVLLALGGGLGLMPFTSEVPFLPQQHPTFVEHLTELTVIVSLMGVGLALDRRLSFRDLSSWRRWGPTWRLLGIAMPLCIGVMALLGIGLGLAPAVAMLIAAASAPTDPVLAGDVQVEGPSIVEGGQQEREEEVERDDSPMEPADIDEEHEVRFALTSEAGLNDGAAFPFVYAAMFLTVAPVTEWGWTWLGWDLVGKVLLGTAVGVALGLAGGWVSFHAPKRSLRVAETGESLMAVAFVGIAYGLAELAGGYGFLAVFACAVTLRSRQRGAEFHAHSHHLIEQLERILTMLLLLFVGFSLTNGILAWADWRSWTLVLALIVVARPLTAMLSLIGTSELDRRERAVISAFGVRGVGSIYYVAYAVTHADFGPQEWIWATMALLVAVSVVVHGVTAKPALDWLERPSGAERVGAAE